METIYAFADTYPPMVFRDAGKAMAWAEKYVRTDDFEIMAMEISDTEGGVYEVVRWVIRDRAGGNWTWGQPTKENR